MYAHGLDHVNNVPTQEYLEAGKAAAEQQLAKAGYRLANVLIEIYNHSHTGEKFLS